MNTDKSGKASAKSSLRRELLAARALLTKEDAARTAAVLAEEALRLPELADARSVAAYVSVGREPGTRALLKALRGRGVRVLLPVLLADNDLDWAAYGARTICSRRGGGSLSRTARAWAPPPSWTPTRCCCPASRWTGQGCGWGGAAAATTGCWPG